MPEESSTPPPYDPRRRVGTGLAGETTRNEGSTILPEANPRPLEVIGDFEVMGKLGQGGMGAVYRARQISLERQVALKILPSNFEADADSVSRFQREARVAASLSHANLVKVYSSGVADGCHYIAMELIEGETLGQWVKRGALPPLEALRIILDVTRALEYGWRTAQLIHRDIKPGNIFLSEHGDVKLGDLGLAKIIGGDSTTGLTQTGAAMGTPHYISPEQARGDRNLDFRADIYSLGCTLYQMLTGHTPYSGHEPMVVMSQHINAPPPAILKTMPHCPVPLARLVSKMMKKQRGERPASYEELITAIETVRAQLDPTLAAPHLPATLKPGKPPSRDTAGQVSRPSGTPSQPQAAGAAAGQSGARKSKLGPWLGIAGGVAALGIIAFFFWPKEEKLTTAQRYAHDHAGELKARADAGEPADATKEAPYVNALGMKFVPVPIIGGPTDGQPVLFSVWDTRVQDYAVFATETNRQWPKVDFEQGPTHPAVNVNWEDARAFCAWLTERERKAGRLAVDKAYRLPSDHEWSCAVGIGIREDPAKLPQEKGSKITDEYPWGTQWPPPARAGNYAGDELEPALAAGRYATAVKESIPGYDDGFVNTSPVGSFAANRFGLYDLSGNVWQWCEDFYNGERKDRVLRGAAWNQGNRYVLLSSTRSHKEQNSYNDTPGFRCVLAPAMSTPPAEATVGNREEGGRKGGAALEPGAIKLFDTPEKVASHVGPGFRWEDGAIRLDQRGAGVSEPKVRDAILRCSVRMNPDAANVRLSVRETPGTKGAITYFLELNSRAGTVALQAKAGSADKPLHSWKLARSYSAEEWLPLELRAVGEELTVSADGAVLGTVHDDSISQPGGVSLYAKANGYFRDIVYVPLDKPGATATGTITATTYPQPPKWTDATAALRKSYFADGVLEADGEWLRLKGTASRLLNLAPALVSRNPIVRIVFSERAGICLRRTRTETDDTYYSADVHRDGASIGLIVKSWQNLAETHSTNQLDGEHEAVFAAQGDVLTLWLDGKLVATAQDHTLAAGGIVVSMTKGDPRGDSRIKKVEYGELPDAAPAAAHLSPSTEPWQDLLADPNKVLLYKVDRIAPDAVVLPQSAALWAKGTHSNAAIRMTAKFDPQKLGQDLYVKEAKGPVRYNLWVSNASVVLLNRFNDGGHQNLGKFALPQPLSAGSDYELELRVTGDLLVAKLNGQTIGEVRDGPHTMSEIGVCNTGPLPVEVKALRFLPIGSGP